VRFHATAIYASGGMVLSGDDLTKISPEKLAMLRKLLPPPAVAARFEDDSFRVGRTGKVVAVLNWSDRAETIRVRLARRCSIRDFWDGTELGVHESEYVIKDMPPHSGRLLVCEVQSIANASKHTV
jgi:alpha-galactosidase